jgi:tetratricopeptide (TPR) repeat protein
MNYAELNEKIRQGRIAEVQKFLRTLPLAKVTRQDFEGVSNLARRVGLPHISIRLMNPIIRAEKLQKAPLTQSETIEYAMALIKIGAIDEGRALLSGIQQNPQALFFLALSFFHEWEYERPIEMIENYLQLAAPADYQNLVAKVNLCAAYLAMERLENAQSILHDSLELAQRKNFRLLECNFLELSAQLHFQLRNFDKATSALNEASRLIKGSGISDGLFVEKWKAILALADAPQDNSSADKVIEIQDKARSMNHWETIRDLDFYLAISRQDEKFFQHLYHGTPYKAYRNRLQRNFREQLKPLPEYLWEIGTDKNSKVRTILDLKTGRIDENRDFVQQGLLPHQLLVLLASDFYRPHHLAALASNLFPGEYYNPHTTPNRVHQIMTRFRAESKLANIALEIHETHGTYRLVAPNALTIKTSLFEFVSKLSQKTPAVPQFKYHLLLNDFRNVVSARVFTAKEFAHAQECSLSTATRVLNAAVSAGDVVKYGVRTQAKYQFLLKKIA